METHSAVSGFKGIRHKTLNGPVEVVSGGTGHSGHSLVSGLQEQVKKGKKARRIMMCRMMKGLS